MGEWEGVRCCAQLGQPPLLRLSPSVLESSRKHLLISCLQSPLAVILEPKKIKSLTVSIVSPSICHEVIGLLSFLNVAF